MTTMKRREETDLLRVLSELENRQELSLEQRQNLQNMEKGLSGEKQFDTLAETFLEKGVIVLHDLSLTIRGSSVQIDSMVLTPAVLYIFEIKNYEGDFIMQEGDIYTVSGQEISNPLTQLNRTASLMRQLLQSWHVKMSLESYIVFVNPSFMLYHAKPTDPLVFSGQIESRLREISRKQQTDPWSMKKVEKLAERLINEHDKEGRLQIKRPRYEYEELRKGIRCPSCRRFDVSLTQRRARCQSCMHVLSTEDAVITQIEGFFLLFPERKATVKIISQWCGEKINKERIQRILSTHYKKCALSVGTYYVQK